MLAMLTTTLALLVAAPTSADQQRADAELIALWLLGKNEQKAFEKDFGDSKWLTDAKDSILYTDVEGLKAIKGLRVVPYDFIKARMQRIRSGADASPAWLIAKTVAEEPSDEKILKELKRTQNGPQPMKNERYYYIEVGIGNSAWHWMKIAVGESDGKPRAAILWRKVS